LLREKISGAKLQSTSKREILLQDKKKSRGKPDACCGFLTQYLREKNLFEADKSLRLIAQERCFSLFYLSLQQPSLSPKMRSSTSGLISIPPNDAWEKSMRPVGEICRLFIPA